MKYILSVQTKVVSAINNKNLKYSKCHGLYATIVLHTKTTMHSSPAQNYIRIRTTLMRTINRNLGPPALVKLGSMHLCDAPETAGSQWLCHCNSRQPRSG